MINKVYRKLKDEMTDEIDQFSGYAGQLLSGETDKIDPGTIGLLQSYLIEIGNKLEKEYGVDPGSPIIHMLENSCEEIYLLMDDEDKKAGLESLLGEIKGWPEALRGSIDDSAFRCSAVAIMRDEGKYLKEWIEHHLSVGVDHFYLYDNESKDNTASILQPYIDNKIVTMIKWPGDMVQISAYNDAISRYKYYTEYMAFIDIDEFIVPVDPVKSVPQIVDEIFDEYTKKEFKGPFQPGGVGVNWMVYGTSNRKETADEPVLEAYLYRARDDYSQNCHIKTICDPCTVSGFTTNPHAPGYKQGYTGISEKGSYLFNSPYFYDASYSRLRINHYYSKSEEDFLGKIKRGWPDQPHREIEISDPVMKKRFEEAKHECNEVYDDIMLKGFGKQRKEN